MILPICLLALLLSTNTGAQRIKGGGRRIISQPAFLGGNALSQAPVVVETIGSNGGLGGLGASGGQFSIDDAQISSLGGPSRLYRVGQSQVPFGLSGLDYYSYPASLLSGRRSLGGKGLFSDNLSGLSPIGYGARRSSIIADPSTSQFSVGDSQIRNLGLGGLYRTGASSVPFGLSGLDYYSYPRNLQQILGLGGGLGQTQILSGGGFTAGDSQIRGLLDPIGQEKVTTIVENGAGSGIFQAPQSLTQEKVTTIVEDTGFGQRQVTTVSRPSGGLRGGQILLRGGPSLGVRRIKTRPVIQEAAPVQVLVDPTSGLGAPIGGFGQRQVITKSIAPAPAQIIQTAPVQRVVSRGLGEAFLTQAARPRIAARRVVARPVTQVVSQPQFVAPGNIQFTLGNQQLIGAPILASQRPTVAFQRPAIAVQRPAVVAVQRPVVAVQRPTVLVAQQPQVISQVKTSGIGGGRIFGRRIPQLVYNDGGSRYLGFDNLGGYRIGDPRYNYAQLPISGSRFANLGLSQGSIEAGPILLSPAATPSFLTGSTSGIGGLGGGIGGIAAPVTKTVVSSGAPLGLSGIGQTGGAKTITQEEVIGPAGDRQVVTTVTQNAGPSKIGGLASGGALGLAGIGQTGGTKTITQEEVIGPAGDSQILTTVTQNAGPSKIGGLASGGALGLAGIGQTGGTKTITQEEVIGPAGDSQIVTTVTQNAGPSKIGGLASGGALGLAGIGQTGGTKTITQEEVIGPAGDSQIVTTVTQNAGPSKIGGLASGGPLGLTGIGQTGGTKTITQEEVIGPSGDSQILTTVTQNAGPSKIGGLATGGPLGLTGIGGSGGSKTITQEEVIGPAGDSQVITTIQETSPAQNIIQQEDIGLNTISSLTSSPLSQISQDPILSALSQETLGDSGLLSGSGVISGGPSVLGQIGQSSVGDIIGQSDISGGGFSDPIVQQSISSGFGGSRFGGYSPRVSFLNQIPYDVPSRTLLRQAVTRPILSQQQQVEQILV